MYQIKRGDEVLGKAAFGWICNALYMGDFGKEFTNDRGYIWLMIQSQKAKIINEDELYKHHLIPLAAKYGLTIEKVKDV